MEPKSPRESETHMIQMVLPSDSNALGTAFGGKVMQWIDICGAVAAQRHCSSVVVTAAIDELHFKAPIRVGTVAALTARVTGTFNHSLEVSVEVFEEDPPAGTRVRCCSALLTFSARGPEGGKLKVPPLRLETEEDKELQRLAEARRAQRLAHKVRSS